MSIALKNKTFLIIEDDPSCRENMNRLFQNFVDHICFASDTISAIKILETVQIDCIICDILLGHENGLDFIDRLRENNIFIPIIVISGYVDEDYLMKAIPLNLVAYLHKPIEYKKLLCALKRCSKKIIASENNFIYIKNNFYYDKSLKIIKNEEKIYKLHHKEILFFEMIIKNRKNIITKDMFYEFVWEFHDMSDSALKNFILRIRRRFGKNFIEAIKNIGYRV